MQKPSISMETFHTKTVNDTRDFTFEFLILFHKMSKFDTKSDRRKREKVTGKTKTTETRQVLVWCLKVAGSGGGRGKGIKW